VHAPACLGPRNGEQSDAKPPLEEEVLAGLDERDVGGDPSARGASGVTVPIGTIAPITRSRRERSPPRAQGHFASTRTCTPILGGLAGHARGVITKAKLHATRYDIHMDFEVLEGDPVETILSLARSRDVDLIVVGSRGRGA
jgi:nucleotide-binding universal stress UspA family protein